MVVTQHPCTSMGESAASGFLKKIRERNVLCKSDSLSRVGKINGRKTQTNFSMTLCEIPLCALRKMLKMMWSEWECAAQNQKENF